MSDYISNEEVTLGFLDHASLPTVPRPLSQWERSVLERILSADFSGAQAWEAQVAGLTVVAKCPDCPTVDSSRAPRLAAVRGSTATMYSASSPKRRTRAQAGLGGA